MPISDGMKYLEQKKFTFLGIMLSVMFGIIGVYTSFFYEKKPEISFDILSNTPVYDLREEIPSLQVIFSGEDIKSKGQSLSILTVRLSNTGNASLLLSHFDPREPFGLSLNNVKILKVDTLGASNGTVRKEAEKNMTGSSGHRRVPASFYENYHVPVPDLITQQQLITEIAVHETNIAAAQNVLAAAPARKQAVMQHYL